MTRHFHALNVPLSRGSKETHTHMAAYPCDLAEFVAKHINGLIAQVRREATDRSKSLLIRDTLKHWSQAFARRK